MDPLTSTMLAELRRHQLRADAARVRLAALARRRRRRTATASTDPPAPVAMTPPARSVPFEELAARFAAEGSRPIRDELARFVAVATARGASPTLLAIVASDDQPDVVRQRAFGQLVVELAGQARGATDEGHGKSDVA